MNTNLLDSLAAQLRGVDERVLIALVVIAAALLLGWFARMTLRRARRLAPPEVQERIDAGMYLLVLDVRSRAAFASGHIAGAVNVPLSGLRLALAHRADALLAENEDVVVVIADRTSRAERAADRLRRSGFQRVYVVEGGMPGWQADRLPLASATEGGLAPARQ